MKYDKIFSFSEVYCNWKGDDAEAKKILGGKGAGLVKMCQAGMPVPPGFTITTEVCNEFRTLKNTVDKEIFLEGLMAEVEHYMFWLQEQFGYMPLVSVRSGAPVSMPGMMDTILNVGLTTKNLPEWVARLGSTRAALDSYRRLIQMLGSTAYGVPMEVFDAKLAELKAIHGADSDADMDVDCLQNVIAAYKSAFQAVTQMAFPDTAELQLQAAIQAVFESWMNPRAIQYRKLNNISEDMGTAVNVQAMVFGNMGDDSGSGVAFTRNPSTGERKAMAEYLPNAQGEDVVAGIRTPYELDVQTQTLFDGKNSFPVPEWGTHLLELMEALENMYLDMVDLEFTVQKGKLWLLQSRTGKRSAAAAFKIACDLVHEDGVIGAEQALKRLTREQFKVMRRPSIDPSFKEDPNLIGIPACPGVVTGKPVFSAQEAIDCSEPCILVTHETTPDDIAGMAAAVGILTQTGGATSHAAVVARAMDKTCVVGATALDFSLFKAASKVTIDGSTGRVWVDMDVPVVDSSDSADVRQVIDWAFSSAGFDESVALAPAKPSEGRAYRIRVAEWWGAKEVLDATVADLAALTPAQRSWFTLDLRPPAMHSLKEDMSLHAVFGTSPDEDQFIDELVQALYDHRSELKGLFIQIAPVSEGVSKFVSLVQHYPLNSKTAVPADYATHSVLS